MWGWYSTWVPQSKVPKFKFEVAGWQLDDVAPYDRCDQTMSEFLDSWSVHRTRTRLSSIFGTIRLDG